MLTAPSPYLKSSTNDFTSFKLQLQFKQIQAKATVMQTQTNETNNRQVWHGF